MVVSPKIPSVSNGNGWIVPIYLLTKRVGLTQHILGYTKDAVCCPYVNLYYETSRTNLESIILGLVMVLMGMTQRP